MKEILPMFIALADDHTQDDPSLPSSLLHETIDITSDYEAIDEAGSGVELLHISGDEDSGDARLPAETADDSLAISDPLRRDTVPDRSDTTMHSAAAALLMHLVKINAGISAKHMAALLNFAEQHLAASDAYHELEDAFLWAAAHPPEPPSPHGSNDSDEWQLPPESEPEYESELSSSDAESVWL